MKDEEGRIRLGQLYRVKAVFAGDRTDRSASLKGRVAYVHPKGRYAVLDFGCGGESVRECFWPEELIGNRIGKGGLR